MDGYVRKLHAILVDKGFNATYSTALNFMVLYQVFDTIYPEKKRKRLMQAFLDDAKTLDEIAKHDLLLQYVEEMRKKIEERYIT